MALQHSLASVRDSNRGAVLLPLPSPHPPPLHHKVVNFSFFRIKQRLVNNPPDTSRGERWEELISHPATNVTPVTCDQLICCTCELFPFTPPQIFQR